MEGSGSGSSSAFASFADYRPKDKDTKDSQEFFVGGSEHRYVCMCVCVCVCVCVCYCTWTNAVKSVRSYVCLFSCAFVCPNPY